MHELGAHRRVGVGPLPAQDLEGDGEQRVAGEDRGRLAEGDMQRGAPAAQRIVVHGRQIVMDQGIAMHAFERGGGIEAAFLRHAEQAARGHEQKGPQTLAAAEGRVAHGVGQSGIAGFRGWRGRKQPVETELEEVGDALQLLGEGHEG